MSIKLMSKIWEMDMPTSEKFVFLCLSDMANDDGVCWPSLTTVATKTNLTRRSVIRIVNKLITEGWLYKNHRNKKDGSNTSNYYTVNVDKLFTSGVIKSPGVVTQCHPPSDTVSPKPSIEPKRNNINIISFSPKRRNDNNLIKKQEVKKKTKTKTLCPDDFAPTPATVEVLKGEGILSDWQTELKKMQDYSYAKSWKNVNWQSAFRNWMRKHHEMKENRNGKMSNIEANQEFTRKYLEKLEAEHYAAQVRTVDGECGDGVVQQAGNYLSHDLETPEG